MHLRLTYAAQDQHTSRQGGICSRTSRASSSWKQHPHPHNVFTPHICACAAAGMPHFQGVPQYMTSGWAGGPVQQAPQPQQQQAPPPTAPADTTSDNIFYAIVALLPELSPKHLLWVKGEVRFYGLCFPSVVACRMTMSVAVSVAFAAHCTSSTVPLMRFVRRGWQVTVTRPMRRWRPACLRCSSSSSTSTADQPELDFCGLRHKLRCARLAYERLCVLSLSDLCFKE